MAVIDKFMGEYRWLSNFHLCDIVYEGIKYPSTEHAYQAAKTLDTSIRSKLAQAYSCVVARRMGQAIPLRADWIDVKIDVMLAVTKLKYLDKVLYSKLVATGDAELIEGNTWGDKFWGVCDGAGENWLGRILMQVRANDYAAK